MILTIFTPAFNRTDLTIRLFESLRAQSVKDFEWIIVNDGSTENMDEIVDSFRSTDVGFPLIYIRQQNQGKHIAINAGAKIARGELFFIVDNDDFLDPNAVSMILDEWKHCSRNSRYGGIVFNKCFIGGKSIGRPKYKELDCTPIDFRFRYKEIGDKAEIIKTSLFLKFPFPDTPGEKFCPEALFFNRIKEKLKYINQDIYYCAYLPDGLTAKIFEVRKKSPINSCMHYKELAEANIPFLDHIKALVNYYRFERYVPKTKSLAHPKSIWIIRALTKLLADAYYQLLDKKK